MRLSKRQEKAIDIAINVLSVVVGSGLDSDKDGSIGNAIDELTTMRDKSLLTKAREKSKKEYLKNLLENSNTITLDRKWFKENMRRM